MRFIYPAIFKQEPDGHYEGYFPDLDECRSRGDTLDEVLENAREAAADWISLELSEDDGRLPAVSEEDDLVLGEGEFVRFISLTYRFLDGWDE